VADTNEHTGNADELVGPRMIFERYDPETDQMVPCAARTVACGTETCGNHGHPTEVADDGLQVVCGVCNETILMPEEAS
jgi:NADH pyrophosphatase NudC (nudix superfamily)